MSTTAELNFFRLATALGSIISLAAAGQYRDAAAALDSLSPEHVDPSEIDALSGMRQVLEVAHSELKKGSGEEGLTLLLDAMNDLRKELPRFRIVLLNETPNWRDQAIVQECGQIWGAYLYDEAHKIHLADVNPSYELHFLFASPENQICDATAEALLTKSSPPEGVATYYCRMIDNIPWDRKHFCGIPQDPTADDYDELVASEVEHYVTNPIFSLPRAPSAAMLASAAKEQCQAGDFPAAVATMKSIDTWCDAAKDLIEQLKFSPSEIDADEAFDGLLQTETAVDQPMAPKG